MVPAPPFASTAGTWVSLPVKIGEMGEAAQQVFGEAEVAAAVLHAGDRSGVALAQAADHARREGDAGDIREVIEVEPQLVAPDAIDDGGIEPEGAVIADAAAIDAGRHQQHAGDALRRRVGGERHHVRQRQRADGDDQPRRRDARRRAGSPGSSCRSATANSAPSPVVPNSVMPSQPSAISWRQRSAATAVRPQIGTDRRRNGGDQRHCLREGRSPVEPSELVALAGI